MSSTRSRKCTSRLASQLVRPAKSNLTLFEYPPDGKSDPARGIITFTEHDQQLLKRPRFLNDTIISLFMQYHLDNFVPRDIKDKVHIFNSFFFAKIKSIKAKSVDFRCASRWLKGVEIFNKDFLIMPVCENDHWVLVIVCYPYRKPSPRSYSIPDEDLREPAVIVLNSWHESTPSVKKTLCQFFKYQWQAERKETRSFAIHNAKPNGIRLIFPDLVQQHNNYDCGLFILCYFKCFLKNPRASYLRMYRHRDLRKWFIENSIDIHEERKRMGEIVNEQKKLWQSLNPKAIKVKEEKYKLTSINSSDSSVIVIN